MIDRKTRAEIRRLFFAEHWKVGTIATQLSVHPDTVRRALQTDSFAWRGTVRPSALDPYIELIADTLGRYPKLTGTRVHEMLRARGFAGSPAQVRRRILQLDLRPKPAAEAFLRLHTLAGEQGQVDWAHLGRLHVQGADRPLYGFVVVLSWSRAVHVHFSLDQTMAAVMRGHLAALQAFGGVPRQLLYDNMKTVVLERAGDAIRFHPRLLELAGHYHFAPAVCAPGRGNEKGRVERRIRDLRSSFLAGRRFGSLQELTDGFVRWRDEVAHARPCPDADGLTVAEALQRERDSLMPLPTHALDTDHVIPVVARKQPYVTLDTNRYSIPFGLVGIPLTLAASDTQVRILRGQEVVAVHARSWARRTVVELPEHVQELARHKRKARTASGRARLLDVVPEAEALYMELAQRGEPMGPQTSALLRLLDLHGRDELAEAIATALRRGTPRATSVEHVLGLRRRQPDEAPELPPWLPERSDVRDLRTHHHSLKDYDDIFADDPDDKP